MINTDQIRVVCSIPANWLEANGVDFWEIPMDDVKSWFADIQLESGKLIEAEIDMFFPALSFGIYYSADEYSYEIHQKNVAILEKELSDRLFIKE